MHLLSYAQRLDSRPLEPVGQLIHIRRTVHYEIDLSATSSVPIHRWKEDQDSNEVSQKLPLRVVRRHAMTRAVEAH